MKSPIVFFIRSKRTAGGPINILLPKDYYHDWNKMNRNCEHTILTEATWLWNVKKFRNDISSRDICFVKNVVNKIYASMFFFFQIIFSWPILWKSQIEKSTSMCIKKSIELGELEFQRNRYDLNGLVSVPWVECIYWYISGANDNRAISKSLAIMDDETASRITEEPENNDGPGSIEAKPEFIVCANDDYFEIAFDPFATIDDDDVCAISPIGNVKPTSIDSQSLSMVARHKPKKVKIEKIKDENPEIPPDVSQNNGVNGGFYWTDEEVDASSNDKNAKFTTDDDDRFKCQDCGRPFKFLSLLKGHARKHAKPSTTTVFTCLVCAKKFRRSNNLKLHMAAAHPLDANGDVQSAPPPKQCEICHKLFSHNGNFKTHMKIHGGVRAFPCTVCDKAFVLAQHLKSHMKLVHSDEKTIQCTMCGKLFNHPGNYKKHMRTHSGERPFKCSICDKSFGQSSNYTAHMRVHTNDKPYKCTECNRTFIQAVNLTQHMRTHASEQPLKCSLCDKTFARINHLRLHERKHHRPATNETGSLVRAQHDNCKPQLCSICGKSLVGGRRSLRMHMKIHENNRPHACQYCDKKFITKNDCSKHMRIHTGEKPYQCELCAKCFRHSASYRIHMRNHNGEKPYRCTHCGKGFSASSDCKKHIKSHENGRLATVTTTTALASEETEQTNILYLL